MKFIYIFVLGLFINNTLFAQCSAGFTEVNIDITTDNYGYEIYWELVPSGNGCGNGTIFSGGNTLVGCNGGSAQTQNPGGYGDNMTFSEGPWCLTDNAFYDIIFVDDWGDMGASFTIYIDGYPMHVWNSGTGAGTGSIYTFQIIPPLAYDMQGKMIHNDNYVNIGNTNIEGHLFNLGSNTITSLDINYKIDNGLVVTAPLTGLNILPFTEYEFIHPTQWNAAINGTYSIKAWASNLNGNADMDNTNDTISKTVIVGPPTPNLLANYTTSTPQKTIIANASDGVLVPRDLDFHPTLTNYDLWVVLKETENGGGKTAKISNAGQGNQSVLIQQDGNAWHFMSLPTGIAFSNNENFATSPGVFDANHNGGDPFTGPSLWSSDPAIYAMPSGGNGSHLDMLHESPFSMGIAHENDNAFWVNDGYNNCVTRYDFVNDHGPGNSDHSDGIVRRYAGMGLVEDPSQHVASHLVLDKNTNMLYIVDSENARIIKLDITTGSATSTFTPWEVTTESSIYSGFTFGDFINTGLVQPSGIDIIEDRLIVSDHSNGEIIIYDISSGSAVEENRIQTGSAGIMGVKIGPDGKIWYVNASTNEVVRLEFSQPTDINEINQQWTTSLYPNPSSSDILNISTSMIGEFRINIVDISGKEMLNSIGENGFTSLDISDFSSGTYFVNLTCYQNGLSTTNKLFVTK